jgi:hypothetical protein
MNLFCLYEANAGFGRLIRDTCRHESSGDRAERSFILSFVIHDVTYSLKFDKGHLAFLKKTIVELLGQ